MCERERKSGRRNDSMQPISRNHFDFLDADRTDFFFDPASAVTYWTPDCDDDDDCDCETGNDIEAGITTDPPSNSSLIGDDAT